jgi:formylmethanofuran dehydrogenase subunit E
MTTYGEVFEFDIRNILNEGDLSRRELFEWWLGEGAVFVCSRCGSEFTVRSDVEEDDELVCGSCAKR